MNWEELKRICDDLAAESRRHEERARATDDLVRVVEVMLMTDDPARFLPVLREAYSRYMLAQKQ